jgi:hypothetical protein
MGGGGITFLMSALDGGEWLAALPDRFTPGGTVCGIHCIEDWADLRASLDAVERKKFIFFVQGTEPRFFGVPGVT